MALTSAQVQQYARLGVKTRIQELERELTAIHDTFPELTITAPVAVAAPAVGHRRMSAKQRQATSARMKTFWAKRRSATKKTMAKGQVKAQTK
jgi:hypothetical protein